MGGFCLNSLCLGVSGTFWMQTRIRREEVGIMKSFGARSVYIIRMLLGEGIVLSTLATLTGCLIYLQYALKEGLYTNMWNEQEILPIYWVNRFPLHFLGVSLIVWIILLIVVSIGIYIPARNSFSAHGLKCCINCVSFIAGLVRKTIHTSSGISNFSNC